MKFKLSTYFQAGIMLASAVFGGCNSSEFDETTLDLSKEVKITAFNVPGATEVVINEATKTIVATFPGGSDVSSIAPTFVASSGAEVTPASGSTVDLRSAQTYKVLNGNLFSNYTVTANVLSVTGFLSHHASKNDIEDDDEKAYANWFFDKYDSEVAEFVSFEGIKDGSVDLSKYKVLTWYLDGNGDENFSMPAIAQDPVVLDKISEWYKAGGNLYLLGYAGRYLTDLQRIPSDFFIETGNGAGFENGDTWGIGVNINRKKDMSGHPIYSGISLTTQGDKRKTFPVIGPGWRENHNYVIVRIPEYLNMLPNDNDAAYDKFIADNKMKWLGVWDGIGDYFMVGIAEFSPKDEFEGIIIHQGIGAIEWQQNAKGTVNPSGNNPYLANIQKLAENAIAYLSLN